MFRTGIVGIPDCPTSIHRTVPIFLLYGRDPQLPTALDFFAPTIPCPAIETDYAWELFQELKRARELARKSIQKAQGKQKVQYDRRAQESKIHAGDLVMLKIEPRFRLDRGYKGPFRVNEVTSTNATIQMMNDPKAELIVVSLQHLSLCKGTFSSDTQPWKGHYKPRRRRQIRGAVQNRQNDSSSLADATNDATVSEQLQRTCCGRAVRRPACYCLTMEGPALQQEGGCKGSHETKKRSREGVQESDHESSHE